MDELMKRLDKRMRHHMGLTHFMINLYSLESDEQKVKAALIYLTEYEAPLEIHKELKSADKATEYIEKANKNFSATSWQSSLMTYTEAVVHAPPDSSELARAYGNRSAALYDGGLYEDAILDIERALYIGCIDKMKAKLYARKARCLWALNEELTPDVEEAINEARKWVAKMDNTNRRYVNVILDNFPANFSFKKPFKKPFKNVDYIKLFPLTDTRNPKIMRASDAIEIKYSEKFGRHVVATRDIAAGETLLVHKPYASVIEPNMLLKYCWNCSQCVRAGVPCRGCVRVIYCNEVCRDMAWQDHHDIECSVIPAILQQHMCVMNLMILRLTVKAYKEVGSIEELKQKLVKIDAIKDPITRGYSEGIFDNTRYASVYTLLASSSLGLADAIRCSMVLYCLAATTKIFGDHIKNFRNLLTNQSAIFIGGLIFRHRRICQVNLFTIRAIDDDGKITGCGLSMNSLLNLHNHSCDPSARIVCVRNVHASITLQGIKKGEQIFISYGPVFFKDPTDKRKKVLKLFNFDCECKACIGNWGPHSISSFRSSGFPMSIDVARPSHLSRKQIDQFIRDEDYIGSASTFASTLSQIMNGLQSVNKYPTQEIMNTKLTLYRLYDTISLQLR